MNRLIIGTVTAQLTPDEISVTPDDRQELVQTLAYSAGSWVPSVAVVDGGVCTNGEKMTISGAKFKQADWVTVKGYSDNRTSVSVVVGGVTYSGCRVRVARVTHSKQFSTITADLEVWMI